MKLSKIKSIEEIGYRKTYDLEIDDKNHNFVINNGVVTSNSHSLSYAMNAYISMWLKVHYPKEYYTALLNFSTNDDLSWYIKQITQQGIKLNELKFGKTSNKFEIDYENDSIKVGISIVKGISLKDIDVINDMKANNVYELVEQIRKHKINKRSYETLVRLEYFKDIFPNTKLLETIITECRKLSKKESLKEKIDLVISENENIIDYSQNQLFKFEKQYLDFYINEHPFVTHVKTINDNAFGYLEDLYSPKTAGSIPIDKENHKMYGVVNDIQLKKSKKTGREYYRILLEDDEAQCFITVFNSADMSNLNISDFIFIEANKGNYGFTKARRTKIEKLY